MSQSRKEEQKRATAEVIARYPDFEAFSSEDRVLAFAQQNGLAVRNLFVLLSDFLSEYPFECEDENIIFDKFTFIFEKIAPLYKPQYLLPYYHKHLSIIDVMSILRCPLSMFGGFNESSREIYVKPIEELLKFFAAFLKTYKFNANTEQKLDECCDNILSFMHASALHKIAIEQGSLPIFTRVNGKDRLLENNDNLKKVYWSERDLREKPLQFVCTALLRQKREQRILSRDHIDILMKLPAHHYDGVSWYGTPYYDDVTRTEEQFFYVLVSLCTSSEHTYFGSKYLDTERLDAYFEIVSATPDLPQHKLCMQKAEEKGYRLGYSYFGDFLTRAFDHRPCFARYINTLLSFMRRQPDESIWHEMWQRALERLDSIDLNSNQLLCSSVNFGMLEGVHHALERGADVLAPIRLSHLEDHLSSQEEPYGCLLELGVYSGSIETVNFLYAQGLEVKTQFLNSAACRQDVTMMRWLVARGADPTEFLPSALITKDVDSKRLELCLIFLLAKGMDINNHAPLDDTKYGCETALMRAVRLGKIESARILLEYGARDISILPGSSQSADISTSPTMYVFEHACDEEVCLAFLKLFSQHGILTSDPAAVESSELLTPLRYAIKLRYSEVTRFLWQRGTRYFDESDDSILRYLLREMQGSDIVRWNIPLNADVPVVVKWNDILPGGIQDFFSFDLSAFQKIRYEHRQFEKILEIFVESNLVLSAESDGNDVLDYSGERSLLGEAVMAGSPSAVRAILRLGAKPTVTCFVMAFVSFIRYREEIVRLLLEYGFDINKSFGLCHWKDKITVLEAIMCDSNGIGTTRQLRSLLDYGALPDTIFSNGHTPLTYIACLGAPRLSGNLRFRDETRVAVISMARLLLERGADLNQVRNGKSPIMWAINVCNVEMVRLLFEFGVRIESPFEAFNNAISNERSPDERRKMIDFLIGEGISLNARGRDGQTPLMLAASQHPDVCRNTSPGITVQQQSERKAQLTLVEKLIAAGAEIDTQDDSGETAAVKAVRAGQTANLRVLCKHGARMNVEGRCGSMLQLHAVKYEVSKKYPKSFFDHTKDEATPLAYLTENNLTLSMVNSQKETLLHQAARMGWDDVVAYLLEKKAVLVNARADYGRTPLMYAANETCARLLLKAGAEVDVQENSMCYTALSLVSASSKESIALCLLRRGANIEHRNREGHTPLLRAVVNKQLRMAKLLLMRGADIEARTERSGYTALAEALLGNENFELASLLLSRGADINAPIAPSGRPCMYTCHTPLSSALSHGKPKVTQFLLERHAPITPMAAKEMHEKTFPGLSKVCHAIPAGLDNDKLRSHIDTLRAFPDVDTLKIVAEQPFSSHALEIILQHLAGSGYQHIIHLDLSGLSLGESHAQVLAQFFSRYAPYLHSLDVSDNFFEEENFNRIYEAIVVNQNGLSLNVSRNPILGNSFTLLKYYKKLLGRSIWPRINFSECCIEADAICESIAQVGVRPLTINWDDTLHAYGYEGRYSFYSFVPSVCKSVFAVVPGHRELTLTPDLWNIAICNLDNHAFLLIEGLNPRSGQRFLFKGELGADGCKAIISCESWESSRFQRGLAKGKITAFVIPKKDRFKVVCIREEAVRQSIHGVKNRYFTQYPVYRNAINCAVWVSELILESSVSLTQREREHLEQFLGFVPSVAGKNNQTAPASAPRDMGQPMQSFSDTEAPAAESSPNGGCVLL